MFQVVSFLKGDVATIPADLLHVTTSESEMDKTCAEEKLFRQCADAEHALDWPKGRSNVFLLLVVTPSYLKSWFIFLQSSYGQFGEIYGEPGTDT